MSDARVLSDHNRHIICVFNRGPKLTHYVGNDGSQLTTLKEENDKFDRLFTHVPTKKGEPYAPVDFAVTYLKDNLVPVSSSAKRVLRAIIAGQQPEAAGSHSTATLENIMAKEQEETGFRKPEGNVAQVHKYLDSRIDAIKAGTVSRKELVEKLVEKGIPEGTATTQAGVWARDNGIAFVRPTAAAENKTAKRSKAKKTAVKQ